MGTKTKEINRLLLNHLRKRPDFNIITTNYSWNLHFEADVYQVKKSGFTVEYEIKCSRGDFLKDFSKSKKYFDNSKGSYVEFKKHEWLIDKEIACNTHQNKFKPNEFYFVCPSGIIKRDEINDRYGLIEILPSGQVCVIKRPKKLHNKKELNNLDLLEIARNFCLKQCSI